MPHMHCGARRVVDPRLDRARLRRGVTFAGLARACLHSSGAPVVGLYPRGLIRVGGELSPPTTTTASRTICIAFRALVGTARYRALCDVRWLVVAALREDVILCGAVASGFWLAFFLASPLRVRFADICGGGLRVQGKKQCA